MQNLKKWYVLDSLWLLILSAYVLGGVSHVPFHGDESTTIWMSRDYTYIFLKNDVNQVRYNTPPLDATEQHLRLITGSLTKYLIGLSWHVHGYSSDQINEQWDWGAGWNYNQQFGHAPDDNLLLYGRLPSALMLAGAVWIVFAIAANIGGRPTAYLASLYFALNPAVLLNGRRAMFEGGLLFLSLFTLLAAIWFLRYRNWRSAVLLGFVSGLALAAKHPAIFTIAVVFGYCGIVLTFWNLPEVRGKRIRLLLMLLILFVIACLLFLLLHPIWWGNPVERLGHVLEARSGILEGQVAAFGTYDNVIDQISGFLRQVFVVRPQYYEVQGWEHFIGDQIAEYESSIWRGVSIGGSILGAVAVVTALCIGLTVIFRRIVKQQDILALSSALVGIWTITMLTVSGWLVPLEWQRYFLMAYPAVGIVSSLGLLTIVNFIRNTFSLTPMVEL